MADIIEQGRYFRPDRLISDLHIRERLMRMNRGASMRVIAKRIGVSRQHVHQVIHGKCPPGPKVLGFFEVEKIVLYRNTRLVGRINGDNGETLAREDRMGRLDGKAEG